MVVMFVIVDIKAVPNSSESRFYKDKSGRVIGALKSSPEKGKANKELIKNISQLLKIPQNNITIIVGHSSRYKKLKIITPLTLEELLIKLKCDVQNKLF